MKFNSKSKNTVSNYQKQVYEVVSKIPKGKVSTYKLIHSQLTLSKIKSSPIAVGQALRRNPFGYLIGGNVPCHRVVSTNLTLHGFHGKMGCPEKLKLLLSEGVAVEDGKVALKDVYSFGSL